MCATCDGKGFTRVPHVQETATSAVLTTRIERCRVCNRFETDDAAFIAAFRAQQAAPRDQRKASPASAAPRGRHLGPPVPGEGGSPPRHAP